MSGLFCHTLAGVSIFPTKGTCLCLGKYLVKDLAVEGEMLPSAQANKQASKRFIRVALGHLSEFIAYSARASNFHSRYRPLRAGHRALAPAVCLVWKALQYDICWLPPFLPPSLQVLA